MVMNSFEILIPSQLQEEVSMHTDPLLFAYRQYWYPDAAAHHSHKPGEAEVEVRLVFVDFSAAFNTAQPHLIGQKLL